ncbi:MAG: acetyltransferase [Thermoleophilia bacterium]|nr:acetyltransferase [Thermoleophilia bacterium]
MTPSLRSVACGPVELRLMTPRVAQELFVLARDPDVSRYLSWPPHETVEDSLRFIHDARSLWERHLAWLPGIFATDSGRLLGCIGISGIDRANARAELGTWLGTPHQGQGCNVPAKSALLAAAFGELDLRRIELLVRVDNDRSLRAVRALPGVRDEGVQAERIVQQGIAYDAAAFALLRSEYDAAAWPTATVNVGSPQL